MFKIYLTLSRGFVINSFVMNALPKLLNLFLLPLLAVSLQAASTYKVRSGDTLSSIARKNGTSASKLMKANGISNPNMLRVGQVLKVSGQAAPKKATTTRPTSSSGGNYTVKSGETLYSIARNHGLSVSQLTNMNPGLNPAKLSVGQTIVTNGNRKAKPQASPQPQPSRSFVENKKPASSVTAPAQTRIEASMVAAPTQSALPAVGPDPALNFTAEKKIESVASISSVLVKKEISFGALASQHRTSTKQLNALNGWNLKPTTILARDSEVYVPGI